MVSDDPFTAPIEIPEPATLAVLIANKGNGTCQQIKVSSPTFKIVDNGKGLLVRFSLQDTVVNGNNIGTSVQNVPLGNILPHKTSSVRWSFIASLRGTFKDFTVSFENVNPLGIPELSLVESLSGHLLDKLVDMGDDDLPDYLVDDVQDNEFIPDHLYSSSTGDSWPVQHITNFTADIRSDTFVVLNVSNDSILPGWFYLRLRMYNVSLTLTSQITAELQVSRSPAVSNRRRRTIDANVQNTWVTTTVVHSNGTDEVFTYLHLLDLNDVPRPVYNYTVEVPAAIENSTIDPSLITTTTTTTLNAGITATTAITTTTAGGATIATTTGILGVSTTTTTITTTTTTAATTASFNATSEPPNSSAKTSDSSGGLNWILFLIIAIAVLVLMMTVYFVMRCRRMVKAKKQAELRKSGARGLDRSMAIINPLFQDPDARMVQNDAYGETIELKQQKQKNQQQQQQQQQQKSQAELTSEARLLTNDVYGAAPAEGRDEPSLMEETQLPGRIEVNDAYGPVNTDDGGLYNDLAYEDGRGGNQRVSENSGYGEIADANDNYSELPDQQQQQQRIAVNSTYGASGAGRVAANDSYGEASSQLTPAAAEYHDMEFAADDANSKDGKNTTSRTIVANPGYEAQAQQQQRSVVNNPGYVDSNEGVDEVGKDDYLDVSG